METLIEWSVFKEAPWNLYIAKTHKGLCYIGSPGASYEEMAAHLNKRFAGAKLQEGTEEMKPYILELIRYFNGACTSFSLPIDIQGTPFQEKVWEALRHIPYGRTVSYSDIATAINQPSAMRAVGSAIGANPVLIAVPCHRVIGKSGAITGYRGGLDLKRYLLSVETKNIRAER